MERSSIANGSRKRTNNRRNPASSLDKVFHQGITTINNIYNIYNIYNNNYILNICCSCLKNPQVLHRLIHTYKQTYPQEE